MDTLKPWLVSHNLIKDKEAEALARQIFQTAELSGDYSEWDSYYESIRGNKPSSWWVNHPRLAFDWIPFSRGSDEYNRATTVLGFAWTPQVIIPNNSVHVYEETEGLFHVTLPTPVMIGSFNTEKINDQVSLEVSEEEFGRKPVVINIVVKHTGQYSIQRTEDRTVVEFGPTQAALRTERVNENVSLDFDVSGNLKFIEIIT